MLLSVIIPCFNEADTIEAVLRATQVAKLAQGWDKEIILVDDGSDALTKSIIGRLQDDQSLKFQVLYKIQNAGKGAAVQSGLEIAKGDYLIVQDADLEYDPNEYSALLQPVIDGKAKSVFGSRTLKQNNIPYSAVYFYGGQLVTYLFDLLFWERFTDIATCYKVFPRKHIPALLASPHKDFVFDAVDLTCILAAEGGVVEVPISYTARSKKGGKKLNALHGIRIVIALLASRFSMR